MIELCDIHKIYRNNGTEFPVLDHVNLAIQKGDYVAVTGASGAGKSTLLYVIGGLIHPDSGEVLFKGRNLYGMPDKERNSYRKREVGFVFQQFHLMPYLSVLENVRLACFEKRHFQHIDSYFEKCSLSSLKDKYPSELSVGEKQRTAFVRAIISEPAILLADEPTGNLDADNSKIVMDLIAGFHKNGGTVVVVSHHPDVAKHAGNSLVLEKGRIVSDQGSVAVDGSMEQGAETMEKVNGAGCTI